MMSTLRSCIFRVAPLLFFLIPFLAAAQGQMMDPVDWTFEQERVGSDKVRLTFRADLDEGWHLYSQHLPEEAVPVPTSFSFDATDAFERIGEVKETGAVEKDDPVSGTKVSIFSGQAVFEQTVRVLTDKEQELTGYVEFMVCDDKRCLPPKTKDFSFTIAGASEETASTASAPEEGGMVEPVDWSFDQEKTGEGTYKLTATAEMDEGWHLYATELPAEDGPLPTVFRFDLPGGAEKEGQLHPERQPVTTFDPNFQVDVSYFSKPVTFVQEVRVQGEAEVPLEIEFMACDDERCIAPQIASHTYELKASGTAAAGEESGGEGDKRTWAGIFLVGFLGGLAALLTPCVFPMIPLTVSFFTKKSSSKAKGLSNALIYSLSIIVIYLLLGFGITVIFGPDAMNALSTNVWFNLAFFLLFVIFAISFFGAFEITLPSSWVNKADQASDKGGLLGTFFMAFTLSLVSFSCTGPIIGTLLVEAAVRGGVVGPLVGMGGFSLALALPFGLFAAFPGWLNSLPQSGGWMNAVKVTLGFLELALALKFLSNADLVMQAGLLKRELFIAIWIGIFTMLTLYLLGFIRTPNDSPMEKLSVPRLLLGMVSLIFTLYLVPGLWGAPLKMISGFPPPMFYSEMQHGNSLTGSGSSSDKGKGETSVHAKQCPHGLDCFHDYEKGLAHARKVDKPVMLDFTGWACVNCRKMEEQVWSDPRVLSLLRNEVVLISLYVDEQRKLPPEEQKVVTGGGGGERKLRTVGNKWSHFQTKHFQTNTQPYYVLLDHEEEKLIEPRAYDPSVSRFASWLEKGIHEFEQQKKAS